MGGPASKETWENYANSEGEQPNVQPSAPAKPADTKADTQNLNEVIPGNKENDTVPMNEAEATNG
jgi:hypothetical protein